MAWLEEEKLKYIKYKSFLRYFKNVPIWDHLEEEPQEEDQWVLIYHHIGMTFRGRYSYNAPSRGRGTTRGAFNKFSGAWYNKKNKNKRIIKKKLISFSFPPGMISYIYFINILYELFVRSKLRIMNYDHQAYLLIIMSA